MSASFVSCCRAETGVGRYRWRHVSPPQPGETEASKSILVLWKPADAATGLVIVHVHDIYMASNWRTQPLTSLWRPVHVICLFQMQSTHILEAPWLSTSAFWISTPGLCSYLQYWACSSLTSQVGVSIMSALTSTLTSAFRGASQQAEPLTLVLVAHGR